jgi:outer membrane biosynthesis protein TonB
MAAAVAGVTTWGLMRAPRDSYGELSASRARHLDLGGSSADLDAGAELRWNRDRHRITAHQVRGTVRWTVADDDTLVIDPGGSTAVTIEASGASLRVEVQMNVSDARMLGATSLSAAVAALVTVVVYQGHVQATSGGQTVNVAPGSTIELGPQRPPQVPPPIEPRVQPPEPVAVGASPTDVQQIKDQLAAAQTKIAALTAELAETTPDPINVAPGELDALRLTGDKLVVPDADTKAAIARAGATRVIGSFKLCVNRKGSVSSFDVLTSTRFPGYDQSIMRAMADWTYRPFLHDGKATPVCTAITFVYTPEPASTSARPTPTRPTPPSAPLGECATMNVEDLIMQSNNQYANGYANAALSIVIKALACKQDVRMYRLAATYACSAHDAGTAKAMFAKVPAQFQAAIEQKCQQESTPLH